MRGLLGEGGTFRHEHAVHLFGGKLLEYPQQAEEVGLRGLIGQPSQQGGCFVSEPTPDPFALVLSKPLVRCFVAQHHWPPSRRSGFVVRNAEYREGRSSMLVEWR